MLKFPDETVCIDCASEYRKIFFNFQNRKDRKKKTNPLFEQFKIGWGQCEEELGLDPLEIPQAIKDYYDHLFGCFGLDAPLPTPEELVKIYRDEKKQGGLDGVS